MNQTVKVIVVTAAGFALGYALYASLQKSGAIVTRKPQESRSVTQGGTKVANSAEADALGDAVAGVLID